MNIDYDPWGKSHAPQRFHRTDPSGRWSPICEYGKEYDDVPWLFIACCAALWLIFIYVLTLFALL